MDSIYQLTNGFLAPRGTLLKTAVEVKPLDRAERLHSESGVVDTMTR